MSSLAEIASHGQVGKLRKFLRQRPGMNLKKGKKGQRALYAAVWRGHADCVKVLLDAGVPVNSPIPSGRLPLGAAAACCATGELKVKNEKARRRRAIVDMLISAGADVDQTDDEGMAALDYAAFYGPAVGARRDVILALLRAGASDLPQQPQKPQHLLPNCYSRRTSPAMQAGI